MPAGILSVRTGAAAGLVIGSPEDRA